MIVGQIAQLNLLPVAGVAGAPGAAKPHVAHNSGNNEWYTPSQFIEAARAVLGSVDLDPASSETANRTVRASTFYNAQDDGLQQFWRGKVWMNPPYSGDLVGRFVGKLLAHYRAGDVPEAIVLVNNATETEWFQRLAAAASALCFPKGRVRFLDVQERPIGVPLQGQAFLYLGEHPECFSIVFADFGFVLVNPSPSLGSFVEGESFTFSFKE